VKGAEKVHKQQTAAKERTEECRKREQKAEVGSSSDLVCFVIHKNASSSPSCFDKSIIYLLAKTLKPNDTSNVDMKL
jgi:hypothetical protein